MIYFDLDGVLRDLAGEIPWDGGCKEPDTWHSKTICGRSICSYIGKNMNVLINAKTFPYVDVFKVLYNSFPVKIITHQNREWQPLFWEWMKKHLDMVNICDVIFVTEMIYKLQFIGNGDILIEDYPKYPSYENIILIDRPYNKESDSKIRVSNNEELLVALCNYI